jgi:RHS repeat-associated protein
VNSILSRMYYIHKDHLASVNVISDDNAAIVEEQSFDAWVRRRNPTNWTYKNLTKPSTTDRGFTGYEHLDQFNLINMNGWVYDPLIGRMLGSDITEQDTDNTQIFNRYSYCFNNPLKYTDPTGWVGENTEGGEGENTISNDYGAPNAADRALWHSTELSNKARIMASSPRGSRNYQMLVSGTAHIYRYEYFRCTKARINGTCTETYRDLVKVWYDVEYLPVYIIYQDVTLNIYEFTKEALEAHPE